MAKKTTAKKAPKSFEQTLWDTADKLRSTVESSEYQHVVLSLIFLKFVSDKFEARRQQLIDEGKGNYVDMVEFYTMKNVFCLPQESRWSTVQKQAKQDDIAVKIYTALHSIGQNNKALKGALPDNYFSRLGIDVSKLAALIDSINNKELTADDIAEIARTYHGWRMDYGTVDQGDGIIAIVDADPAYLYVDKLGFCKSATLDEIKANDFVLTPGRYVGAAEIEDAGIPFEVKMAELTHTLYRQMGESEKLDAVIRENMQGLGFGE